MTVKNVRKGFIENASKALRSSNRLSLAAAIVKF